MANPIPMSLGEIIRRQRELGEFSMRQFASMVGISNPYLSQIERGLRDPSDQVLRAIAESLQVSAESLYRQAGFPSADEPPPPRLVVDAIRADTVLTGRQRQAMIEIYEAFAAQNGVRPPRRRRLRAAESPGEETADPDVAAEAPTGPAATDGEE